MIKAVVLIHLHTRFDNCLSTGRVPGIPASSAVIKAVVLVCLHTSFDHCLSTGRVLGTMRVKGLLN